MSTHQDTTRPHGLPKELPDPPKPPRGNRWQLGGNHVPANIPHLAYVMGRDGLLWEDRKFDRAMNYPFPTILPVELRQPPEGVPNPPENFEYCKEADSATVASDHESNDRAICSSMGGWRVGWSGGTHVAYRIGSATHAEHFQDEAKPNTIAAPYIPNPSAVICLGASNKENSLKCPKGYAYWVEDGKWKASPSVSNEMFGNHSYGPEGVGHCVCGCVMRSSSSHGPVDPFGACPLNPKTKAAPEPKPEFRYFKDPDGTRWKMPSAGGYGFLIEGREEEWSGCTVKIGDILKYKERDRAVETDADGNPLVVKSVLERVAERVNSPEWQARALAAEEELGEARNRIKELAEAGQVSMDHALTNGITAGNCHMELSACKEALRVARVALEAIQHNPGNLNPVGRFMSGDIAFSAIGQINKLTGSPISESTPAPFTVQAGKRYRRRDGQISGVIEIYSESFYPAHDPINKITYSVMGRYVHDTESDIDLVAEYLEGVS